MKKQTLILIPVNIILLILAIFLISKAVSMGTVDIKSKNGKYNFAEYEVFANVKKVDFSAINPEVFAEEFYRITPNKENIDSVIVKEYYYLNNCFYRASITLNKDKSASVMQIHYENGISETLYDTSFSSFDSNLAIIRFNELCEICRGKIVK